MNERTIVAKSGERFTVRAMEPDDAALVLDGFEQLSEESRYRRFFTHSFHALGVRRVAELVTLRPGQLVLLAFDEAGDLAGGVRAVIDDEDPAAAELALTLGDQWQDHGLGTQLLALIASELRTLGIERLHGYLQLDNGPARTLLEKSPATWWIDEPGILYFEVLLARGALPSVKAMEHAFSTAS